MFGGSQHKKPPGPTDELYKLDMSTDEFYWTKTACSESPAARWHHSANTFNGTSIVVFGGFSASKTNRYFDDVWVLDTTNDTWWRPDPATRKPWNNCPVSRGAHSATVVGSSLYVFGGYGGTGYSRRDFNDMTALDLDTWEWNPVETTGEQPEPRSGHQTVATTDAGADKLYVSFAAAPLPASRAHPSPRPPAPLFLPARRSPAAGTPTPSSTTCSSSTWPARRGRGWRKRRARRGARRGGTSPPSPRSPCRT